MLAIDLYLPGVFSKTVDFPTEWDELSTAELMLLGRALRDNASRAALFVDLLQSRAKLRRRHLRRLNIHDCTVDGLPLIDLLLQQNLRSKNPFPWLGRLMGPTNDFEDMTVGEFEDCEVFFGQYNESRDIQHLRELANALWRETVLLHLVGARRTRYHSERQMGKGIKKLDDATLLAIYLWYAGCRALLAIRFPNVFGGVGDEGATDEGPDLAAFTKIIHYGAGPKNGTRADIRAGNLNEFLFECELQIIAAKELEEKHKEA